MGEKKRGEIGDLVEKAQIKYGHDYKQYIIDKLAKEFPEEVRENIGNTATRIKRKEENGRLQRIDLTEALTLVKTHRIGILDARKLGQEMSQYELQIMTQDEEEQIKVEIIRVYGNAPVDKLRDPEYKEAYIKYILNRTRLSHYSGYLGELEERDEIPEGAEEKDKYYINMDDVEQDAAKQIEEKIKEEAKQAEEKKEAEGKDER